MSVEDIFGVFEESANCTQWQPCYGSCHPSSSTTHARYALYSIHYDLPIIYYTCNYGLEYNSSILANRY